MHNGTVSPKVTVHPTTYHEGAEGELKYRSLPSSTSGLVRMGGRSHAPDILSPQITCTPFVESWVGPRAGLEVCGKSHPH